MALLEIRELVFSVNGVRILDGINLELREGYVHAIVGPNGAGKSTLAYTLMGLENYRRFEGQILFDGEPLGGLTVDQRARKGMTLGW